MVVQCATLLEGAGFDIAGLHSPDAPLREWAEQRQHPNYYADFAAFRQWCETIAYDYLFSVINFRILPASMLASPKICAINYHDAPLPKYAGSHACAWALHDRAPTHGITWHVMTELVDGGDILTQATYPLTGTETLQQLEQRCYLTAMRSFRALLPTLKTETFVRTPQDLTQRTYYARSARPPTA